MNTIEYGKLKENTKIYNGTVIKTPNIKNWQNDTIAIVAIETGERRDRSHIELVEVDITNLSKEDRERFMYIGQQVKGSAEIMTMHDRAWYLKEVIKKDIETYDNQSLSKDQYIERYGKFSAACKEILGEMDGQFINNIAPTASKSLVKRFYDRVSSALKTLNAHDMRAQTIINGVDSLSCLDDLIGAVEKMEGVSIAYQDAEIDKDITKSIKSNQEQSQKYKMVVTEHYDAKVNEPKVIERIVLDKKNSSTGPQYLVATKYINSNGELCVKQESVSKVTPEELNMDNKIKAAKLYEFMGITSAISGASAFSEQMIENISKPTIFFNLNQACDDAVELNEQITQNNGQKSDREVASEFLKDPNKLKNCYKECMAAYVNAFADIVIQEKQKLEKIDSEDDELDEDLDGILKEESDIFKSIDNINPQTCKFGASSVAFESMKAMRDIALYACDYTQQKNIENNNSSKL